MKSPIYRVMYPASTYRLEAPRVTWLRNQVHFRPAFRAPPLRIYANCYAFSHHHNLKYLSWWEGALSTGRGVLNKSHAKGTESSATQSSASSPMRLVRIPGDGRCMFRALVLGKHFAKTGELTELVSDQKLWVREADSLRSAICDELVRRKEDLAVFIDGDFDKYVEEMRRPSTWGGEPELACAPSATGHPISVYQLSEGDNRALTLVSQYDHEQDSKTGKAPLMLFFHRLGHYNLLLPPEQPRSKL